MLHIHSVIESIRLYAQYSPSVLRREKSFISHHIHVDCHVFSQMDEIVCTKDSTTLFLS